MLARQWRHIAFSDSAIASALGSLYGLDVSERQVAAAEKALAGFEREDGAVSEHLLAPFAQMAEGFGSTV